MVIISTSAVALIIQAVSPELICETATRIGCRVIDEVLS